MTRNIFNLWSLHRPVWRCLLCLLVGYLPGTGSSSGQTDDSLARALVRKHIEINQATMSMPGYRVQIYYGVKRASATEVKGEFMRDYPHVPSYLVYQQPNFKVRVGDYKTRMQALRLLDEIQGDFPAAFVVPDAVSLPDLGHLKD